MSWGTNPAMVSNVTSKVPTPEEFGHNNEIQIESAKKALSYMDLKPDTPIVDIPIDRVFIGSCTNARLEDLKDAAQIVKGKIVNSDVHAMVVPGSQMVKHEAEKLGLD